MLLALSTSNAWAAGPEDSDRVEARNLAYAGIEAYANGDYIGAHDKLDRSYGLLPVPTLGLWSARALVKLGKWVEAEARYAAVASMSVKPSDPRVQQTAKLEAAREHLDLLGKLPRITLRLSGATLNQVDVRVDGVALRGPELRGPQPVNPGRHVIVGSRGSESSEVVIDVAAGAQEVVWLRFSPEAEASIEPATIAVVPPPSTLPDDGTRSALNTAGALALTAGGAALTTSLVSYFLARQQYEDLETRDFCVGGDCSPVELDAYHTWRTLHLVSLVSGAVLAGGGAGLLLFTPSPERDVQIGLSIGRGSAALVGKF